MSKSLPTVPESSASGVCSRRRALMGLGLGALSFTSVGAIAGCTSSSRVPGDSGVSLMDGSLDAMAPIDAGATCADSDICLDVSDPANAVLQSVDGAGIVDAGFDRIMIVRSAASGASAFAVVSSVCPHARCDVDYDSAAHNLPCYCHGSLFGLDGTLLRGPSRTGLRQYRWEFDGTNLTIHSA